jgi:hypothetical protein
MFRWRLPLSHQHVVCFTTRLWSPPKRVLQRVRSSVSFFNFQYLVVSLRLPSSCLRLLSRLPVSYIFHTIAHFIGQFLRKILQIHVAFRLFILCGIFFPPWLSIILHFLFHYRSNWSQSFSSTTLKNIPGISYLPSERSKFQHHTKLCSKCNTL